MDVRVTLAAAGCLALCLALLVTGVALLGDEPDEPRSPAPPPVPVAASTSVASQPRWDPADLAAAPASDIDLDLRTDPSPPSVREDPMPAVVAAWAEKGGGPRLLGIDGRWRSTPDSMEINQFSSYPPDPPVITADGTRVAAATVTGLRVLDVTTGVVETVAWPEPLRPPWDWAPSVRWLPGEQSVLVGSWKGIWAIGLDGSVTRSPYPIDEVADVFGIDPAGPVHQNDYPRSTLITYAGREAVHEAPFPQCERLVAAHGLVACTTGSLRSGESGPVVVGAATGDVVAYAPIRDRSAWYSDNGHLTVLGFVDPGTLLLQAGPRDEPWYLATWSFEDGTFERVARTRRDLRHVSVAPGLLG